MSLSVQKQSVSGRTPPVLAVLPDLSGYRVAAVESVQTADTLRTPRKAVPAVGFGPLRTARKPHWSRGAVVTVSLFMAILLLITWKIVARTQATPTASPLKGSYMTRFATPPQQAPAEATTPINRPREPALNTGNESDGN